MHIRVRIWGYELLGFQKTLRTYKVDGPIPKMLKPAPVLMKQGLLIYKGWHQYIVVTV